MSTSKPSPIMQQLTASMNAGSAQYRGADFHEPKLQDFVSFDEDSTSRRILASQCTATLGSPAKADAIRLISWNIDVLVPFAEERMSAAIVYLKGLVASTPPDIAMIIFLQEMSPSDLGQLAEAKWIQECFYLTDVDNGHWLSQYYGTTTLIDKRLMVNRVFRVPFASNFNRDGLFVDIALSRGGSLQHGDMVLRLCNVHLESLVADPPVRPGQLKAAAEYLGKADVACALLAGDTNAIQPFDRTLHLENGLKDAYLELGGQEDSDEGYTWGYQVAQWMKDKFGCSRMDKIMFSGVVQPKRFERIGMGVKVADEHVARVKEAGELEWVTDHYGVMGDFELCEGWNLRTASTEKEIPRTKLSGVL
ncbi:hypothetical protein ACN47E_007329 [Coniothyrium glycines]